MNLMNLVETISDDQSDAPCLHGNIIPGHACYCHHPSSLAPRKCPIWSLYGESDLTRWKKDQTWEDGCPFFEARMFPSKPPLISLKLGI